MKKAVCRMLTVALLAMVIGCQPTPEVERIVAKDGALEDKIEAEPKATIAFTFPQNINEAYTLTDKLNVNMNADVSIPAHGLYPVYSAAFAPFSSQQVSSFIRILFGDTAIYKKNGIRTKAAIEAEIIGWKKLAADAAANPQSGDIKTYEETINQLENELSSAPDKANDTPYDGSIDSAEDGSYLLVYGGRDQDTTLEMRNYDNMKSAILLYRNGTEYWADGGGVKEQADGLSLFPLDALDLVTQWLYVAGMEDMPPILCRVGSSYQSGGVKGKEGYVINCERRMNGIPVTYNLNVRSSGSLNNTPDYSQQFNKEKLTFTVDDTGITTIKWENPFKIELLNENVQILPFEDIIEQFKRGLKFKYAWVEGAGGVEGKVSTVTLEVTQMKLGLAVIPQRDKAGGFMLVPAWDFFGTESSERNGTNDVIVYNDRSFVTINAVDGSIIE